MFKLKTKRLTGHHKKIHAILKRIYDDKEAVEVETIEFLEANPEVKTVVGHIVGTAETVVRHETGKEPHPAVAITMGLVSALLIKDLLERQK